MSSYKPEDIKTEPVFSDEYSKAFKDFKPVIGIKSEVNDPDTVTQNHSEVVTENLKTEEHWEVKAKNEPNEKDTKGSAVAPSIQVHEDDRKLFVGALPQEANDTDIKDYFGTYGEIDDINLKIDPFTGRSRGFAFIVFRDFDGIDAALKQTTHAVKGKKVTCKKAVSKQGKIYVGKLPAGEALSKEDLQAHFEQFGSVVELVRPVDKNKNNEPKNFAFVTFAREDAAKKLVKQGQTFIDGAIVEIKKVTKKEQKDGGGWGAQGCYGAQGGWGMGYGDPYAYGGFGRGYGDPYRGYGGYGGGWGLGYGNGAGGKMRGTPKDRRGGRPY